MAIQRPRRNPEEGAERLEREAALDGGDLLRRRMTLALFSMTGKQRSAQPRRRLGRGPTTVSGGAGKRQGQEPPVLTGMRIRELPTPASWRGERGTYGMVVFSANVEAGEAGLLQEDRPVMLSGQLT